MIEAGRVLVVDDELDALASIMVALKSAGVDQILCCEDARRVLALLEREPVDLVLLDVVMPYLSGDVLLAKIKEAYQELPVIMTTGANALEMAVTCMKAGAVDYLVKPLEKNKLASSVKSALAIRTLQRENQRLAEEMRTDQLKKPGAFSGIAGMGPRLLLTCKYIEAVAPSSHPLLITGETGVGKELFALAAHKASERPGEFVALNVAGLDDTVFADTLFGHVKGAFTGADTPRDGLVQKAAGGTLFLDEIGDISPSSQVKLLRLLQEREYFPLGADTLKRSTARIVAATCKDWTELEKDPAFRRDLLFRLKAHHIHIPALRDRSADIPALLEHFVAKAAAELKRSVPACPSGLLALLRSYHYPGNIRELESMVCDAMSATSSGTLAIAAFERSMLGRDQGAAPLTPSSVAQDDRVVFGESLPTLKEVEERLIHEALARAANNQAVAAHWLGISRQALNQRLNRKEASQRRDASQV